MADESGRNSQEKKRSSRYETEFLHQKIILRIYQERKTFEDG